MKMCKMLICGAMLSMLAGSFNAYALISPWANAYAALSKTIGMTSGVTVEPPVLTAPREYTIYVKADGEKGWALAQLLRNDLNPYTRVAVVDADRKYFTPSAEQSFDFDRAASAVDKALDGNPYFVRTEVIKSFMKRVFIVLRPAVIQYYSDDISQYQSMSTFVAADLFREFLNPEFGSVPIQVSSDVVE
ncbi:MAG: hypothetical protein HQK54_18600 [Oligoflexales bacterium]|nr:hypothetical protein [Oligoflexales bacterium]